MSDDDWWRIEFGTPEEARGDYDHDIAKQQEVDTQTYQGETK